MNRWGTLLLALLPFTACTSTLADHLAINSEGDSRKVGRDMNPDDLRLGSPSSELGDLRLQPEVCQNVDLASDLQPQTTSSIVSFLDSQKLHASIEHVRADLDYVQLDYRGAAVRLRVAILPSAQAAGRELHEAILQHGRGSWGVHRANLAVLGPIGSVSDILELNSKTKLACWGVLTVGGLDDTFVIPGGYSEL